MSFLSRLLPFLFEDVAAHPPSYYTPERLAAASPAEKRQLIAAQATPSSALLSLANDPDSDIRVLLATRVSQLLPKMKKSDSDGGQAVLDAIRQLTEDSVTPVRIALASALKDVAHLAPAIARKLADDAERAVAEPIIRYSLALSDEHLLELIALHPQDWHVVTIAQRSRLTEIVSDSLIGLGNFDAAIALLSNDYASISERALSGLGKNAAYAASLKQRKAFNRQFRREFSSVMERHLYAFLRNNAQLDKQTTNDVLKKIHQRVDTQDKLPNVPPGKLTEDQLRDAVQLGQDDIVLAAVASRAKVPLDTVKRMLVDAEAAKPVIALCVKAGLSMSFSVLLQQRLARLPSEKIIYPKDGTDCPITPDEVKWQLEFFDIA